MNLTDTQDYAIQARIAMTVGAEMFDRLFAGICFDELDGDILFVYAKDEDTAAEIEESFSLHIAILAADVLKSDVEIVMVLPKVLQ